MTDTEKLIEELVSDRQKFNEFVYTPINDALSELHKRKNNKQLREKINSSLAEPIPEVFINGKLAVLAVNVATANFEIIRFLSIIEAMDELTPLLCEYLSDKFTDNNSRKYNLGRMTFYMGRGKHNGEKIFVQPVIDFQQNRGRRITEVETLWGQNMVEFHHELFKKSFEPKQSNLFDISNWYAKSGGSAKNYYTNLLKIFVSESILFENYLLNSEEAPFTKEVFLPSFIKVLNETGKKPLIVALEPTDIEGDKFWLYYPPHLIDMVKSKIAKL